MSGEIHISGVIYAEPSRDCEAYTHTVCVRNPYNNTGVGLFLRYVEPNDLRALADFLEDKRKPLTKRD